MIKRIQNRKHIPPNYSFNFAPACKMHLRNLRATMTRAVKAINGDPTYRDFAILGLPILDQMINDGKFLNLPETI